MKVIIGVALIWVLKFIFAFAIVAVVGSLLGKILEKLRLFLPSMIFSAGYLLYAITLAKGTLYFILLAISFVCTIISIIIWARAYKKKAIRKSRIFSKVKFTTLMCDIPFLILISLYPFEAFPAFKSVCTIIMALLSFMPLYMQESLTGYKVIKDVMKKNGIFTERDINGLVKKGKSSDIKYEDVTNLLENLVKYEKYICIFEGVTGKFYLSQDKLSQLLFDIDTVVRQRIWIPLDELRQNSIAFFNDIDLKIFISDFLPHLTLSYRENNSIVAYDSRESIHGVCDCCGSYSDKLIETQDGKFCSEECKNFMADFYNAMKPSAERETRIINIGAVASVNPKIQELLYKQSNYSTKALKTRHGQAAETLNTEIDRLLGYESQVVGRDNAKNGPDRIRNGVKIQTKYCKTARETLRAALDENGNYRYGDMLLEVPKDQYEDVLKMIEERKLEITPLKGHLTQRQSVSVSRAGTITSICYDFIDGSVACGIPAFEISGAITCAFRLLSGDSVDNALEQSIRQGFSSAMSATSVATLSAQMKKIPQYNALKKSKIATKSPVKIETSDVASIIVFSAKDFYDFFNGYLSNRQLAINVASTSAGVIAGSKAAEVIGEGIGGIVGGMVASMIASGVIKVVSESLLSSDAKEMQKIFNEQFHHLSRQYLLTSEEIKTINDEIMQSDTTKLFKLMYHDPNHYRFAAFIILDKIAVQYSKRECIKFVL